MVAFNNLIHNFRLSLYKDYALNCLGTKYNEAISNAKENSLQCLLQTLNYFVESDHYIDMLNVRPYYKGSELIMYLHKNISKTYFTCKEGYKIIHPEINKLLDEVRTIHKKLDWSQTLVRVASIRVLPFMFLGDFEMDNSLKNYVEIEPSDYYYKIKESNKIYSKIIHIIEKSKSFKDFKTQYRNTSDDVLKREYGLDRYKLYTKLVSYIFPRSIINNKYHDTIVQDYNYKGNISVAVCEWLKLVKDNYAEKIYETYDEAFPYNYDPCDSSQLFDLRTIREGEHSLKNAAIQIQDYLDNLCKQSIKVDHVAGVLISSNEKVDYTLGIKVFKYYTTAYLYKTYGLELLENRIIKLIYSKSLFKNSNLNIGKILPYQKYFLELCKFNYLDLSNQSLDEEVYTKYKNMLEKYLLAID